MMTRLTENTGLMGKTHALSALAVIGMIVSFIPEFLFQNILQTRHPILFIAFVLVVCGYALWPDFDNTSSTAISSFGLLGRGISKGMRSISMFFFTLLHTKREEPNPHRGFWHTLISVVLVSVCIQCTMFISKSITLPLLKEPVSIGFLFSVFWVYAGCKLAIAGLCGKWFKNQKKKFAIKIAFEIVCLLFAVLVLFCSPQKTAYNWIPYAAGFGYLIHILGDLFTAMGAPIFWPMKIRGKRWFMIRILKIKAGSETESMICIPILYLCLAIAFFHILYIWIA